MTRSSSDSPHARAWRHFRSTPRWWGLGLLVLVLLVAFWRLGLWQFENATSNAQQQVAEAAQQRPPGELEELLPLGSTFPAPERGRTATTSGTFTGEQFLVPDRQLDGETGAWVVSRFETDAGASLAVLRGLLGRGLDLLLADLHPRAVRHERHDQQERRHPQHHRPAAARGPPRRRR